MHSICCFVRSKKVQIAVVLLACLSPLRSPAATDSLPNFDKRLDQAKANQLAVSDAAKENAASVIRNRVKDVRIDTDEIPGSPKFVASTREFLTGANGSGGAVSATTAAAFDVVIRNAIPQKTTESAGYYEKL